MQAPIKLRLKPVMEPPCKLQPPNHLLLKVEINPNKGTANIHGEAEEQMIAGHPQPCVAVIFEPNQDCEVEFSNPEMFVLPNNANPVSLNRGPNPPLPLKRPDKADVTTYHFHADTGMQAPVGAISANYLVAVQGPPLMGDPKIVVP